MMNDPPSALPTDLPRKIRCILLRKMSSSHFDKFATVSWRTRPSIDLVAALVCLVVNKCSDYIIHHIAIIEHVSIDFIQLF